MPASDRDPPPLEAEIDRLYALPLDEFVAQRGALGKRLRGAGEREAAERVKGLRKPTAGAWALNQAVRRRRSETSALLAAGERLRAAHEALISGGGRDELREAMAEERSLSGTLADCAEAIASETGKSGPALKERVRATLHAAALDPAVREELEAGRLVREHEAVGLAAFGGGAVAPVASGAPVAPKKQAIRGGRDRSADAKVSADAKRSADRERAAERKRAAAAERAAAKERKARLAEAEREVAAARSSHRDAEAALDEAREAERAARDLVRERKRELTQRERELKRLRR
ncbi:MAG: hypothetical protein ABW135_12660 [Thermoleophilaceae bacterium]